MTDAPEVDDPAWGQAERVAAAYRAARADSSRRRAMDRTIGPIVAALWAIAVVTATAGLGEGRHGYGWELVSYLALACYGLLGAWWLGSTGRYLLRGDATSIRAGLPPGVRRAVRRQLALREPVDPRRAPVVRELAHQARELNFGQVAFFAFYVPLYLDIAHSMPASALDIAFLSFGGVALLIGFALILVNYRRLTRIVQQDLH